MAIDTSAPRSRRALLAGTLGGVAAVVTASIAGAQRVIAGAGDDGKVIHVGDQYFDVRSQTRLLNSTNNEPTLGVANNAVGTGLRSISFNGRAVEAWGFGPNGIGIVAEAQEGRGGRFQGEKAQIRLIAASAANHPVSGAAGDIFFDGNARLWFCPRGGTTWLRIV